MEKRYVTSMFVEVGRFCRSGASALPHMAITEKQILERLMSTDISLPVFEM